MTISDIESTSAQSCIFCQIVAGELPCTPIYGTATVLAFLDVSPLVKGHTLVIPKAHWDPVTAVPGPLLHEMITVVQKIAGALTTTYNADGINIHQSNGRVAGQVVPHVHFHVVPRFETDRYSWNWRPGKYDDPAEMDDVARAIRAGLES